MDQGVDQRALVAAVRAHSDGAVVALRVAARAPATRLAGRHGDALKLRVQAPPVDGAANTAVRRWLAGVNDVPLGDVEVLSGLRSRDKSLLVHGRDCAAVRAALAAC